MWLIDPKPTNQKETQYSYPHKIEDIGVSPWASNKISFCWVWSVLDPLWMRLKCSFWLFFYLKSFPHEVQVVICNLRNLYHKIISIPVAMYELNMDYWEMQVRELFCDKCKSWLVTRSDLVSHHTSTHKVGRQYQQRLGYWLRICHGILFTLNISVLKVNKIQCDGQEKFDGNQKQVRLSPELYSWYCELFFCVNGGKSNSQTVFFYLSFLHFADIFYQSSLQCQETKDETVTLFVHLKLYYVKKYENIFWFFLSLKLFLIIDCLVNETVSQSVSCQFKRSQ